jgi:uncharacterized membrane protein YhaH (DUF805 family)
MEPLAEVFSFQGRANRAWYFWHILLDDVVMITALILLVAIGSALDSPLIFLPAIGVLFAGVWAGLAMTVKRLHDIGRPGWHWFLLAIPLYNIYLGLVLLFEKGTSGANRYGRDPLEMGRAGAYLEA